MIEKSKSIIYWFRNDLRLQDNEALTNAINTGVRILPVYCIDPRWLEEQSLGFKKAGVFRIQFLLECLRDLKFQLQDIGGDLMVKLGKPEEVIYALAKYYNASAVYYQEEVTQEEIEVEDKLEANLLTLDCSLYSYWGSTLLHYDDLPYPIEDLDNIFSHFKNKVEKEFRVRELFKKPGKLRLVEQFRETKIPVLEDLGYNLQEKSKFSAFPFRGGETNALMRLKEFVWEKHFINTYKETRNELIGSSYSSKFSAWLALGAISPRTIYFQIKKYEEKINKNDSTYWLVFELLWRDYFRFIASKFGNRLFYPSGLAGKRRNAGNNEELFAKWATGNTGIPFIDANMRELNSTGFMSNRGRQNVASFLVHDLKLPWKWGAKYFESQLVDYDPCSNYANWQYVAGIGNDPRENRYFNILTQAKRYDPDGTFVKLWCRELKSVPKKWIHHPFNLSEMEQKLVNLEIGKQYPIPCLKLDEWKSWVYHREKLQNT